MTSMRYVMNFIVENKAEKLGPSAISNLFDRMGWIIKDEGMDMNDVRCEWLEGDDFKLAEIAMLMEDVLPYDTKDRAEAVFSKLVKKWPSLKERCDFVLKQYKR